MRHVEPLGEKRIFEGNISEKIFFKNLQFMLDIHALRC